MDLLLIIFLALSNSPVNDFNILLSIIFVSLSSELYIFNAEPAKLNLSADKSDRLTAPLDVIIAKSVSTNSLLCVRESPLIQFIETDQ